MRKKRKFSTIIAIVIFLVLGPSVYFGIIRPNKAVAGWWNDTWGYRKAITFNNNGSAVSNQKVKVDVNTASAVDPNVANFNTADLTFTPNIAKRKSVGSSSPFAAGVMVGGKLDNLGTVDVLTLPQGTQLNGNFYANLDTNQGSISFWITPEWNGNDNLKHYFLDSTNTTAFSLHKDTNNSLYFTLGSASVSTNISTWTAGVTYNVVVRWDTKNTLDSTNYASISINNSHTLGITTAPSVPTPSTNIYLGTDINSQYSASAEIEGLTVYRRPIWDGSRGVNAGAGNEILSMVGPGSTDPTILTGSWDVVFDLPTNASTGILGVGGTDANQAWSHPHSSNVLYTSTTNTGGFMMNGTYTSDGWEDELNGGGAITAGTAPINQRIYSGGYQVTSDGATANQGIGRTASIAVGSTGANYVVRALAHSDGTSIPQVQIWDTTNNSQITSLTGTVGSGRTGPDTLIFTFELPTVARNGVAASCTNFDVRLVNTQTSGTVYWHQIELLTNLIDNPSVEVGTTSPYIPSGWNNEGMESNEGFQEPTQKNSGNYSYNLKLTAYGYGGVKSNIPAGINTGDFVANGFWGKIVSGAVEWLQYKRLPPQNVGYSGNGLSRNPGATGAFVHTVSRHTGQYSVTNFSYRSPNVNDVFLDDAYTYKLTPVSLTVTPASLINSTESTGIRVDGRDVATAPISNLTTTAGTIKFNYTPRHSAADSNKFTETGSATADAYIGEWYNSSNDYIRLYWDSANTMLMKYSMNGVGGSGTWNATGGISPGSTYNMKIDYTGGSTMTLGVGNTSAITLSSIPSAFTLAPNTAYWGTGLTGLSPADATFAQTSVSTGVKMKSNCDDIRFTDQNGKELDYYYDSTNGVCNAESTDFYVLMPSINTGANTIYMYYGNQSATKGSKNSNFSQSTFSQSNTITASEEQSKAPVAYWAMDEGQGDVVHNSAADPALAGTRGTGTSAPSWQTEDMCVAGKCLKFDGNDFVSIGNTALSVQTVSFWVKPTSATQNFIDLDGGTHYISDSSGTVSATGFSTPTIYVNGKSNGTLTANQWNHIEVTTATSFNATNIKLGRRTTTYLTGFLDDVKLFAYARSTAEIKADYNSMKNAVAKGSSVKIGNQSVEIDNGLVGYWKMDEASWNGTANEVIDSSGNSNHGVGVGTIKPTTGSGKFGNGGVFDGISQYASIPYTNLNFERTDPFSISAWIKRDTDGVWYTIFGRITDCGSNCKGYAFWVAGNYGDNDNTLCFDLLNDNSPANWLSVCTPNNIITNGSWQHVAATYDGSSRAAGVSFYLNGIKQTSTIRIDTLTATTKASVNLRIGDDGTGDYFDGSIDELHVYNRALSPAEVRNLYEWAPGPKVYLKTDEGVGSTAFDSSGYSNNGLLNGGSWKTGKYGKGIRLNGTSDNVSVNDFAY